jgi:hypothetical protein
MPGNQVSLYLDPIIQASGMTRNEMFLKMGYKNTTKAFRRLNEIYKGNKDCPFFIERICDVLSISIDDLMAKINEYNDQIKQERMAEEKKAFRPHIFAITSRHIPSPIFVGAMTYGMRFHYFDNEFLELEKIQQLTEVLSAVREHYFKRDKGIPAFGSILCYVLRKYYDESREDMEFFDPQGAITDDPGLEYDIHQAQCSLTVKGRDITHLFKID